MTRRSSPFWRLSRRARGELSDAEAAGLVDEQRQILQLDGHVLKPVEVALVDAAAPDCARGNASPLGNNTCGELLGGHFKREKADDAAVRRLDMPVGANLAAPGVGHIVGDVGRESRFTHTGTASDNN